MAAAKTSLVLFLFALVAISANLQMVSAGLECATSLSVKLDLLNECTSDTSCADYCKEQCLIKYNRAFTAYACIPDLVQLLVKRCSCCCASV
ncbi:hypothetical protein MKX03_031077 [Papaver bracteatum]|nr:hypothetical protein MKX03_031077 [Papaver bracteatum]